MRLCCSTCICLIKNEVMTSIAVVAWMSCLFPLRRMKISHPTSRYPYATCSRPHVAKTKTPQKFGASLNRALLGTAVKPDGTLSLNYGCFLQPQLESAHSTHLERSCVELNVADMFVTSVTNHNQVEVVPIS